jgi:beta-galactosidase
MPHDPLRAPVWTRRILYGGDYNPEQWPEDVREIDAALMRRARWNVATLPVFGWVHLNPAEGVFTFEWLDRVIERLASSGVDLCLATATASTPAWVDHQYPDALTVDDQRRPRPHGNRHAFCPSSPSYARLSGDLVRALARRYGSHPGLRLWHVNNEYGGSAGYCYCERCAAGFRAYLQRRYGALDALNEAWSTAFWGHTYSSFSQIDPPFAHGEGSVQMLKVDWRRFQTESYLACYEREASILRELTPHIPVTTNLMGAFMPLDYRRWAQALDVVAWDNYPAHDAPFTDSAFKHSLMRGLKDGQPFLLMEQSPSQQNWSDPCRLKPPGQLRLQSYQAVAHGAESVMYFQWRRSRGGIEKLHGAVIEHHGRPEARVFREVAQIGAELEALGAKTLGGRTPARVAVVFDWECWWALLASSGPTRELDYLAEVHRVYASLHVSGISTDVIGPDADLDPYDVVVLPTTYIVRKEQGARIASRVARGATLVATFFSGVSDENDRVHDGGAPGPLRGVLGVTVEEFDGLPANAVQCVRFSEAFGEISAGSEVSASLLADRIWTDRARTIATFGREFYAGDAAVTVCEHGRGEAFYVATRLEDEALARVLRAICARKGIGSPLRGGATPKGGIEVTVRATPGGAALLYVLNHGQESSLVPLPVGAYVDLLTGAKLDGTVRLEPRDVLILEPRGIDLRS